MANNKRKRQDIIILTLFLVCFILAFLLFISDMKEISSISKTHELTKGEITQVSARWHRRVSTKSGHYTDFKFEVSF